VEVEVEDEVENPRSTQIDRKGQLEAPGKFSPSPIDHGVHRRQLQPRSIRELMNFRSIPIYTVIWPIDFSTVVYVTTSTTSPRANSCQDSAVSHLPLHQKQTT